MRFLVHYEGAGEGCDYTIGCNHALRSIEADSPARAIKALMTRLISYGGEYDDAPYDPEELESVTIYTLVKPEVTDVISLDLDVIRTRRRQIEIEDQATLQEAQDRAQYESLKARFAKEEATNEQA